MSDASTDDGQGPDDLKVHVETTTRCGGSCGGCALGARDRTEGRLMDRERLEELLPFVSSFLAGNAERATPKEVSINCVQGDHLLADPAELAHLVAWIKAAGNGQAIGFMTASAIGSRDRVARAVEAIHAASHALGQPVWLDLVFDPAKTSLPKFAGTYGANIDLIRQAFGEVDLNVNVGPDTVALVPPSELHALLRGSGFKRFTANLTPVPSTAAAFALSWTAIVDWMIEFLDGLGGDPGYEVNVGQVMATSAWFAREGVADRATTLHLIGRSAARSVFVDASGALSHTQAGFGDVAFGRRVGWRTTHVAKLGGRTGAAVADDSAKLFAARVAARFASHPACDACRFAPTCARTGVAAVRAAMDPAMDRRRADECPSGLRPVFERFEAYGEKGRLRDYMCVKDFSYVPKGFEGSVRPNARPMDRGVVPPVTFAAAGRVDA